MNVFAKGSFKRDVARIKTLSLLIALREKIDQIENAPTPQHITGLKLLRGYTTHYRIQVRTEVLSFRIGAVIRGNTIRLVRFLPRHKIYKQFP
jgi:mRNA-degrading endonuclease RelE of RelBE toxin-antitoxin system